MCLRVGLFSLIFLYQSVAWSDITIRVLDKQDRPVANAVVSILLKDLQGAQEDELVTGNSPANAVMDQVDKQFLPHVLVVEKGQQVVFPNSDQVRHHVYSFSKPNDFEIKLYSGDQADPVSFDHPGIVVLGCNIHDQMVGYLYIAGNEQAKVTDAQGYAYFEGEPMADAGELDVTLWHSRLSSSKIERVKQTLGPKKTDGNWQIVLDLLPEATKETRKFKPRFQ